MAQHPPRWSRSCAAPSHRPRNRQSGFRPPASLPGESFSSQEITFADLSHKDTIRQEYFAAQDCTATSETDKHVVHCLDYVRQALQCHADTNLEFRVVLGTGDAAFTGYSGHQCRDFDRVFRFAEKWRVYDGKNASERIKISEEETIPGRVINYDYVSSRGDPVPQ